MVPISLEFDTSKDLNRESIKVSKLTNPIEILFETTLCSF